MVRRRWATALMGATVFTVAVGAFVLAPALLDGTSSAASDARVVPAPEEADARLSDDILAITRDLDRTSNHP
ncbi:MAG: hypothetical protein ACFB22_02850 [Rhodothalassiaceae bacterium]